MFSSCFSIDFVVSVITMDVLLAPLLSDGWKLGWDGSDLVYLCDSTGEPAEWKALEVIDKASILAFLRSQNQKGFGVQVRLTDESTGHIVKVQCGGSILNSRTVMVNIGLAAKLIQPLGPVVDHSWYLSRIVVPLLRAGMTYANIEWTEDHE